MITKEQFAKMQDHSILEPNADMEAIRVRCQETIDNGLAAVYVNPCFVSYAKGIIGDKAEIGTVVGFPHGANTTKIKVAETEDAYDMGCDEFDMVINVGALKDGKYDYVRDEIKAVVEAAKGRTVKVIIETFFLTDEEKVKAVELSCEAGAHFVKTCTGFNEGIATVHDIELMRKTATPEVKVKASSGIKTYADAKALIEVGAERLGTSSGAKILAEAEAQK